MPFIKYFETSSVRRNFEFDVRLKFNEMKRFTGKYVTLKDTVLVELEKS